MDRGRRGRDMGRDRRGMGTDRGGMGKIVIARTGEGRTAKEGKGDIPLLRMGMEGVVRLVVEGEVGMEGMDSVKAMGRVVVVEEEEEEEDTDGVEKPMHTVQIIVQFRVRREAVVRTGRGVD